MKRTLVSSAFVAALVLAAFAIGAAQERSPASWKVGLARARITPDRPVWMAGYDAREKPFEGVESDIYAKVLALEDAAGNRGVVVTTDVVGFSAPVAAAVWEAVRKRTSLERGQFLLNASHNHSGPLLSLEARPRA
jgi:ABC-type amino acid transport substrate-binding protein